MISATSLSLKRKNIRSVELCADPVREACFTVAQTDEEMMEMTDSMSDEARRERLHRHMNNETGALEIAAQCLVDFPETDWDLRMQLARQCSDEARHISSLHRRLKQLGGRKGEFPVGNFEWCVTNMCDTLAARLAIQNRTFEAGQMDLLGTLRNVWRKVGDETTAEVLEHILCDEVNHVRFANQWIRRMVSENKLLLLKVAVAMRMLSDTNEALLPAHDDSQPLERTLSSAEKKHAGIGVNVEDRRIADFTDDEINEILRQNGMSSILDAAKGSGK